MRLHGKIILGILALALFFHGLNRMKYTRESVLEQFRQAEYFQKIQGKKLQEQDKIIKDLDTRLTELTKEVKTIPKWKSFRH